MTLADTIDDATRSRLINAIRKAGGGKLNIYAIMDRKAETVVLIAATCPEEALKLIRKEWSFMGDWTLATTNTRRVVRNVVGEPEIITAYAISAAGQDAIGPPKRSAGSSPNERTRIRAERRRRKKARDRESPTPSRGF